MLLLAGLVLMGLGRLIDERLLGGLGGGSLVGSLWLGRLLLSGRALVMLLLLLAVHLGWRSNCS